MLRPEILSILPNALVELYLKAEADILADMARRIRGYNYYIPAAIHQTRVLEEMGMVRETVLRRLGKLTGQTEEELKQLMLEAGEASLRSDDEVYRRAGLNPPPLRASSALRDILQAGLDQTAGTFQNLTGTTANTAAQQFERALDRTWMQIPMGGIDYNTAVTNAIKDLAKDGIKAIRYPSGREDSLETAVRRAAVTGINQTMGKLQMTRLEEMEWDLVETTAHAGARPSHAVWQGRIFSIRGSGNYPDFYQSTGYGTGAGLCGWNCSHSFRPWQEGMSRIYTPEMLEAYEKDTVSYNGEQIPRYEALQKQRALERNVRRYKRENLLDGTPETAKKLKHWQSRLKDFTEQTGLKRQSGREMVPGFGKSQTAKASYVLRDGIHKTSLQPAENSDIIKVNIAARQNLEATAKNFDILLPDGTHSKLAEGTEIVDIEVFAGYGSNRELRVKHFLAEKYGGNPEKWQHSKGHGYVVADGKEQKANIHWFEEESVGIYEMKVKGWSKK